MATLDYVHVLLIVLISPHCSSEILRACSDRSVLTTTLGNKQGRCFVTNVEGAYKQSNRSFFQDAVEDLQSCPSWLLESDAWINPNKTYDEMCKKHEYDERYDAVFPADGLDDIEYNGIDRDNKMKVPKWPFQDKSYVKTIIEKWFPDRNELHIPKTYFVAHSSEEITEDVVKNLPPSFVGKGTHGSGMVIIAQNHTEVSCIKPPCATSGSKCRNPPCQSSFATTYVGQSSSDLTQYLQYHCKIWLGYDYATKFKENSYSKIVRGCIFEEFIRSPLDDRKRPREPDDFKVFIVNGKAMWGAQFTHRWRHRRLLYNAKNQKPRKVLIEEYYSDKQSSYHSLPNGKVIPAAPCGLKTSQKKTAMMCRDPSHVPAPKLTKVAILRIMKVSEKIAAKLGMPYLRVDFLVLNADIFSFGEITFTSAACTHGWGPRILNHLSGNLSSFPGQIDAKCLYGATFTTACSHLSPYVRYPVKCLPTAVDEFPILKSHVLEERDNAP